MIYLTFNDHPSGIFKSQVVDVCDLLEELGETKVWLVSFVSFRSFFKSKRKIHNWRRRSIVLPMFPGISRWKLNIPLLWIISWFIGDGRWVCRGVFAFNIANSLPGKRKLVYDGRGAIASEASEYNVFGSEQMNGVVAKLERKAVLQSTARVAVSNELINYWRNAFDANVHGVVIPCSLSADFTDQELSESSFHQGVKLIFSGSSSGWHSFDLLEEFLKDVFAQYKDAHVTLLTPLTTQVEELIRNFPSSQLEQNWVDHSEVKVLLRSADYGILIREPSVTNKVASPVKFAEYLCSGLKVVISDGIGDFTSFVQEHQCGIVYRSGEVLNLQRVDLEEKKRIQQLGREMFSKKEGYIRGQYQKILDTLNENTSLN